MRVCRGGGELRDIAATAAAAILAAVAVSGCLSSKTPTANACTSSAQCGQGLVCLKGTCVDRECTKNVECAEGLFCSGGVCAPVARECLSNAECTEPRVCADGKCVELAPTECEVAKASLDFGTMAIGATSLPVMLEIRNHTHAPFTVSLGAISRAEQSAFAYGSDVAAGDHLVPAMARDLTPGTLLVPLVFTPRRSGELNDTVPILRPCGGEVALRGIGVEHTLLCSSATSTGEASACGVDFGFVNPEKKAVQTLTFSNVGSRTIRLSLGALTQPPGEGSPFALEDARQTFAIPPGEGGQVSVAVSFSPSELGRQAAALAYVSDDPDRPSGVVVLTGYGGGPVIDVQPGQLDFGPVAVDTYQFRRLSIANVGTDVGGTTEDNLILAAFENGGWREKQAVIDGANASEFGVEWRPQGYTQFGLAEGQSAGLRVKFAPIARGPKQATLHIYSNDPGVPIVDVPLAGQAMEIPTCDYDLEPASIDFGSVASNRFLTLSFSIVNRGPDSCFVSMLDRTAGTSDAFALVSGPQGVDEPLSIPGRATLTVPVRFAPRFDGRYAGEVSFFISSPFRPEAKVALSGVAEPSCLMIAPREVDFGAISFGCSSRQRNVTLYNTCSSEVRIFSIDLRPGSSTEFSVTNKPALPLTIAGGSGTDIGVTYHPVDVNSDSGSVAVTMMQGNPNPLVVALSGSGSTDSMQTDIFAPTAKVDVMLIIDDSCSMADKQAALARNFNAFVAAADANQIDYHIAATSVSLDGPGYACGRFVPITGSNPRIITAATPSKEVVFAANVQQGTGGTGTESLIRPAYLALSNPLIGGHNTGFYRDDARLALVVFSDAADQDPLATPVGFYEGFLLNLKGVKRRNEVSYSGFVPTSATEPPYESGCAYDDPAAGQDTRAVQLVQHTGGLAEEICSGDWPSAVGRMGARVFGARTTWFLSNTPDRTGPDSIVVTVDGAAFPQVTSSGETQWIYDVTSNSIQIEPRFLPSAGSTVSVAYHVACL